MTATLDSAERAAFETAWALVRRSAPGLAALLDLHGEATLGEHIAALSRPEGPSASHAPLVGPALVAGHLGVESRPQSIQATLLGRLGGRGDGRILLCGTVSLRSWSHPRGVVASLGATGPVAPDGLARLSGFPHRLTDRAALAAPAMDPTRLVAGGERLDQARRAGLAVVARELARFGEGDFPAQALRVNAALARRLVPSAPEIEVATLEIVAAGALARELSDPDSPLGVLLFDPPVRKRFLDRIGVGPPLFFGLDARGRRVGLPVVDGALQSGAGEIPLSEKKLVAALAAGALIPGSRLCLAALGLAGLDLAGGRYMLDYLPRFLTAAREALGAGRRAEKLAAIRTGLFLDAVSPLWFRDGQGRLAPAGLLELLAANGPANGAGGALKAALTIALDAVTLREGVESGLAETLAGTPPFVGMGLDVLYRALAKRARPECTLEAAVNA